MILVDTCIWVDHLRRGNAQLTSSLEEGAVVCHPFIIGELACGDLPGRKKTLGYIMELPQTDVASHFEVLSLIDAYHLMSCGLGFIDAHLLASARLSGDTIWTNDVALKNAAAKLGVLFA
jgi:predicted nucleic acid-binding protein